jgi:hypothetical protein
MLMCFVSEICVRWTINAFDSRFGIFISDKFGVTSATFSYCFFSHLIHSTLIVLQSIWTTIQQMFIYPCLVSKVNIPIPWMGIIGYFIMFVSYIFMSAAKTPIGAMIAGTTIWVGFGCVSPSSVSIISVRVKERSEK